MAKKNLLVAVDFSEASKLVVQKAGELAQQLSARIVLLHVVEPTAAYRARRRQEAGRRRLALENP